MGSVVNFQVVTECQVYITKNSSFFTDQIGFIGWVILKAL